LPNGCHGDVTVTPEAGAGPLKRGAGFENGGEDSVVLGLECVSAPDAYFKAWPFAETAARTMRYSPLRVSEAC